MTAERALLRVKNLKKLYPAGSSFWRNTRGPTGAGSWIHAVDGVSFEVAEGESLGLVGESGCGKTTTARLILRLEEPTSGQVFLEDLAWSQLRPRQLRKKRDRLQIVFQDPYSSLNPRQRLRQTLAEPLRIHLRLSPQEEQLRIRRMLERVGLAASHLDRYPHEFSGGQRQRIAIARALILNPRLLVLDEPVSALDVSIQAQILNLLKELQRELRLTYLFISHDLSVVKYFCQKVAVMYLGKIVEIAETARLYCNPQHPYTEALLSAVPQAGPQRRVEPALPDRSRVPQAGEADRSVARIVLQGDPPDPSRPPSGCRFHPRCRYAQPSCRTDIPSLEPIGNRQSPPKADPPVETIDNHLVACPVRPFFQKPSVAAIALQHQEVS